MTHPFPPRVRVPPGLVKPRLAIGLPPVALLGLLVLAVGPIALLGVWWPTPLTLLLGIYVATEARRDPDFLTTWAGEMRLKQRYH